MRVSSQASVVEVVGADVFGGSSNTRRKTPAPSLTASTKSRITKTLGTRVILRLYLPCIRFETFASEWFSDNPPS